MELRVKNNNLQKAFTLVELAIVIVIIGLLVGGVLQGQELIKQAQIRKLIKYTGEFQSSKNVFFSKYNGLPGDMRNADNFFGTSQCAALLYVSTPTCSSTGATAGNGLIDGGWNNADSEPMRYWIHLSLAKILPVSPISGADYTYYLLNVSKNKAFIRTANGDHFNVITPNSRPGTSTTLQNLTNINYLFYSSGNVGLDGSFLEPQTVQNIDSKIDDGLPLSGKILAGTGSNNSTTECIAGTEYNMTSDNVSCNIYQALE